MDGDVDGADAQLNNPPHLPVRQVGEGDIIAHQEAQPGVVVLEIEGVPAAGGHLVHEAEQAVIGAGPGLVHEVGLKVQPQVRPLGLFHPQAPAGAVGGLQLQQGIRVIAEKAVVQHVLHGAGVDGEQPLPRPDPRPLRRRASVDGSNKGTHGASRKYMFAQ